MAPFVNIPGAGDPRVIHYTRLRDMDLRHSLEAEHGIFLGEGQKVIERALDAGHTPVSFLMTPRWAESFETRLAHVEAPCFVMSEAEIERVTGFHVHRGALAAFNRPQPRSCESLLANSRRLVVLEDVNDHANVGAIFRTVAALGWDGILLSPRCADPWYRRSLKVSMGAVLTLPFARVEDWYTLPDLLTASGYTSLAMTLAPDAVPLPSVRPETPLALIVGSEGHGLSHHWQTSSSTRVTIPMSRGVDSLNVAASVAIACWELAAR